MALAALIVAIIAVVVSLAALAWTVVWSIWQHRDVTQAKIYVTAGPAVALYGEHTQPVLAITATNAGVVPVTINSVVAEVEGGDHDLFIVQWLLQTPGPLPQRLEPGDSWNGHVEPRVLERGSAEYAGSDPPWKITIRIRDATDRAYRAPAFDLGGP